MATRRATRAEVLPVADAALARLAARLPAGLRLGTSSWTFPGWAGLVYAGSPTEAELVRAGLRAYAACPLYRTVGIDRSYYAPLAASVLAEYAAQLPTGFRAVAKVWSEITTRVFPRHRRLGARAGLPNPSYLDPEIARSRVIDPWLSELSSFAGPLVFEFPPMRGGALPGAREFALELDRFFAALPEGPAYAVELRNRELFTPRYLETLRAHGVGHVLNFWAEMPTIGEQLAIPGIFSSATTTVARLMLAPGQRYEERERAFFPFDKIVVPQPAMRAEVVALWRRCHEEGRELYVLVNNKAEGSAPLTIRAMAELITAVDSTSPC